MAKKISQLTEEHFKSLFTENISNLFQRSTPCDTGGMCQEIINQSYPNVIPHGLKLFVYLVQWVWCDLGKLLS